MHLWGVSVSRLCVYAVCKDSWGVHICRDCVYPCVYVDRQTLTCWSSGITDLISLSMISWYSGGGGGKPDPVFAMSRWFWGAPGGNSVTCSASKVWTNDTNEGHITTYAKCVSPIIRMAGTLTAQDRSARHRGHCWTESPGHYCHRIPIDIAHLLMHCSQFSKYNTRICLHIVLICHGLWRTTLRWTADRHPVQMRSLAEMRRMMGTISYRMWGKCK